MVSLTYNPLSKSSLDTTLSHAYRKDETKAIQNLLNYIDLSDAAMRNIRNQASELVTNVRKEKIGKAGADAFMLQYDLSSEQGLALMCLAEAFLRVPDTETLDKLIEEKISSGDWQALIGQSQSFLVNTSTRGLALSRSILSSKHDTKTSVIDAFQVLIKKMGAPVIRQSVKQAMKFLSQQFVLGRDIEEALKISDPMIKDGYRYSYDMLGEAAFTQADADKYFKAYADAINTVGESASSAGVIMGPGISIKLSALHPRYEFAKHDRVMAELVPKLLELVLLAKKWNIALTIDAEEADRLDISLAVFEAILANPSLGNWEGLGLAVQAYQKRAFYVLDWLTERAKQYSKRIKVRLVKGAYWDYEIKHAQELGLPGYPVFTRKASTDVSYIACAKKMLSRTDYIYPQFATHNAHTIATILTLAGNYKDFEFQCLHGMGRTLYKNIIGPNNLDIACRIYAPVGSHRELLPYLVRRLLENGANSSFVNRIIDSNVPVEKLVANPINKISTLDSKPHPHIPLPSAIYPDERQNSKGIDITNIDEVETLHNRMETYADKTWTATPTLLRNAVSSRETQDVNNPSDHTHVIGTVLRPTIEDVEYALDEAEKAFETWRDVPVATRADYLFKMADLLEENMVELMAIASLEAGKTLPDAISEVREAVDFCRYYAKEALKNFGAPIQLPGPTGEHNHLEYHPRGILACISPWNFPLAIFLGQITAGLASGNVVLAKPADQTPLIAAFAVNLLHQAGFPKSVIQLLPGKGRIVGSRLVEDERVAGVMFTGSTGVAKNINLTLANRAGAIVPLIAETGGMNAMVVDSSALPEQVIADVILSAFGSAGQRCSALRVLLVQNEIAERLIPMLKGAMKEIDVNLPHHLSTDVGPVIDHGARQELQQHFDFLSSHNDAELLHQVELNSTLATDGSFFAPAAFELKNLDMLTDEVFGPILHVIRYKKSDLIPLLKLMHKKGYALTLGIHSRLSDTIDTVRRHLPVGNSYVNRSTIGAVVGVQPFGGEGLSGTGPKAGGPNYLTRLCFERTLTIDTTATGGNAHLMSLDEE